ncbi:MAG: tRNA pseudouridine(55) synthase TruB, partial [Bacteroidia bacterium]|nr:tRNA pseudouridine(55) synthase TruB [Bacteroidia bacterium]
DVVRKIRSLLVKVLRNKKLKVGHAGTLDPLATGLMIIATGKATKRLEELQSEEKEYFATIRFGATTPSYDLETEINQIFPFDHLSEEMLCNIFNEMIGESFQLPPVFSAKFIDGKRAYKSARSGEMPEMKPNRIFIKSIMLMEYNLPVIKIKVECSKGTYIRSLAHDIGIKANSGAHLTGLIRTRSGSYLLDNAISVKDFENLILSLA